ncbi:MAG: hypothetical protein R3A12_06095 [Ignavibacteria bacterium]
MTVDLPMEFKGTHMRDLLRSFNATGNSC